MDSLELQEVPPPGWLTRHLERSVALQALVEGAWDGAAAAVAGLGARRD